MWSALDVRVAMGERVGPMMRDVLGFSLGECGGSLVGEEVVLAGVGVLVELGLCRLVEVLLHFIVILYFINMIIIFVNLVSQGRHCDARFK